MYLNKQGAIGKCERFTKKKFLKICAKSIEAGKSRACLISLAFMKKTETALGELKLIGLTCRTSLNHEMDSNSAKIPRMLQQYFENQSADKIAQRFSPGITYCIYTNYESDYTGEYDYFIGEVVSSFRDIPEGFSKLTIPAQRYVKITAGPGPMPEVCIHAWQEIWATTPQTLGGERNYFADFEVYDERTADPNNTTLDIYVGITTMLTAS